MKFNRSQSAVEFLVAIGVLLIFTTLVVIFFSQRYVSIQDQSMNRFLESTSRTIQEQIFLAKELSGNYERNFSVPPSFSGADVEYSLVNGRELIISIEGYERITFLPSYTYGEISSGVNKIVKKGPLIGLCSSDCSESYVFNATGDIQCSEFSGVWDACDLAFDDTYIGVRVLCPSTPVDLLFYNVDDDLTVFNESSSIMPDTFTYFNLDDSPIEITESGLWQINATCGANVISNSFYVEYGTFSFEDVTLDCPYAAADMYYNCTEDQNFTIFTTIQCNGGECGDANIFLDPIGSS